MQRFAEKIKIHILKELDKFFVTKNSFHEYKSNYFKIKYAYLISMHYYNTHGIEKSLWNIVHC